MPPSVPSPNRDPDHGHVVPPRAVVDGQLQASSATTLYCYEPDCTRAEPKLTIEALRAHEQAWE